MSDNAMQGENCLSETNKKLNKQQVNMHTRLACKINKLKA